MTRLRTQALLFTLALAAPAAAQSAPPNGPRQVDPRWHALVGATLVPAPDQRIDDATIVMRDGVITAVGQGLAPPAGARVWDCRGRWVYAGLIEPYLPVDAPVPPTGATDAHWNSKVAPQRNAVDGAGAPAKTREELRALGFTAAALAPEGGVFRGRGALVLLDEPSEADGVRNPAVVRPDVYHTIAFESGGFGGGYPSSLMGCVALVRQTLLDARTYARNHAVFAAYPQGKEPPPVNDALAALGAGGLQSAPLLFVVEDELEALTAHRTASEFERPVLVVGRGTEYQRAAAFAAQHARLIEPLAFPEAPKVASLAQRESMSLRDLMEWEQAPTNPRRLLQAGVTVALTTYRLEKRSDFAANLRSAIRHGLTEAQALAMVTTVPAQMLGVSEQLGEVAPGKMANLVLADGPLFAPRTHVLDVWVRGQRHVVRDPDAAALEGEWKLTCEAVPELAGTLRIGARGSVKLAAGDRELRALGAEVGHDQLDFAVPGDDLERPGVFTLHATRDGDRLFGSGRAPDGSPCGWSATREAAPEPEEIEATEPGDVPEELPVPFGAFGGPPVDLAAHGPPQLWKNATLWLVGPKLSVGPGALVIRDGKVVWVGENDAQFSIPDLQVVDLAGKHVTPGLIDCHSHTGIAHGVNEGSNAVTAEVRVGDALDPDDIAWYRELAGGVTAVQQLHGSANPIGGQSSVVKLRWGVADPQDMRLRGAKPGIKFALGENVKRSNFSSSRGPNAGPQRYPASRMGVEALIRDRFQAARDYTAEWSRYKRLAPEEQDRAFEPRRDLTLEALAEILGGFRLVHCHSYRQDEILMLCRVAQDFGFKIGTFQHALEAYKVAEAVRDAAIGASVFSDWWAYKFEVFDAIPYNGEILRKTGITVSFNSDSDELARRLNTEAAKAMKYGDLSAQSALGFVTIGPALQLGLDARVGSIDVGKDADLVVWSGEPMSSTSRVEATYIEGREYFSLASDAALRAKVAEERQRIVQKLLRGAKKKRPEKGEENGDEKREGDRPGAGAGE
jgi:imidazolonepropionase-like amidohydrolase